MSTGCVLFVIAVTSCVVCRRRDSRRRQLDNRRNSRTEALRHQNEATKVIRRQIEAFRTQNEAINSRTEALWRQNEATKVLRRQIEAFRSQNEAINGRTEALKALTSSSDNGGAGVSSPEVLTRPNMTNMTSHPAKMSATSSVANGSASSGSAAGYQPVTCLSPQNNKVRLFLSLSLSLSVSLLFYYLYYFLADSTGMTPPSMA